MNKLLRLELKNNYILYLAYIPILIAALIILFINEMSRNSDAIEIFVWLSIPILSIFTMLSGFLSEKWSVYLSLPIERNKQLLVKVLTPLILSLIYGLLLLIALNICDFVMIKEMTIEKQFIFISQFFIILPALITTFVSVIRINAGSLSVPFIVVASIIMLVLGYVGSITYEHQYFIVEFSIFMVLNICMYLIIRTTYIKIEV